MYDKTSLLVLCAAIFVNAYGMTFLFSFIGLFVVELKLANDKNEAGYYAGYITSAFMMGRTISSMFWGIFADKFGRKPVMLVGLGSIALLSLPFGLTSSLFSAVAMRFTSGFMNGIVATAKTMTSEMCSEEDAAWCMSLVTGLWSMGLITGPAASGLLSYPSETFPKLFPQESIFGRFPFLLACLVASVFGVFGFVLNAWGLKETLPQERKSSICGPLCELRSNSAKVGYAPVETLEVEMVEMDSKSQLEDANIQVESATVTNIEDDNSVMTTKVMTSVAVYCLFSFSAIFMDEVIPLWALASRDNGGLELAVSQIGSLLGVGGTCILMYQFFVYPRLANRFTLKQQFVAGCIVSGTFAGLISFFVATNSGKVMFWISFVVLNGTRVSAQVTTFTACGVMCNNAVVQKHRGKVNGFTMGCASFFKMLGPTAGSILFAWSINSREVDAVAGMMGNSTGTLEIPHSSVEQGGFVNVHFTFLVVLVYNYTLAFIGTQLPEGLNRKLQE